MSFPSFPFVFFFLLLSSFFFLLLLLLLPPSSSSSFFLFFLLLLLILPSSSSSSPFRSLPVSHSLFSPLSFLTFTVHQFFSLFFRSLFPSISCPSLSLSVLYTSPLPTPSYFFSPRLVTPSTPILSYDCIHSRMHLTQNELRFEVELSKIYSQTS
jgi:hypothetical protein